MKVSGSRHLSEYMKYVSTEGQLGPRSCTYKISNWVFSSTEPGFLAHLSRRLIGELIVYPWSGVCRQSSSSIRPSSSKMLKHFLLRNRLADQNQILCGASLGRGKESLFAASGSHDQDCRHAHIWYKPFKNLLQNRQADFHETWYAASGTTAHHSLFK